MAIVVQCSRCGATLNVKDSFAGRKIHCKTCNQPVSIPGAGLPRGRRGHGGARPSRLPVLLGIAAGAVILLLIAIAVFRNTSLADRTGNDGRATAQAPSGPITTMLEAEKPAPDAGKVRQQPAAAPPGKSVAETRQPATPQVSPVSTPGRAIGNNNKSTPTGKRYPNFPDAISEPPAWLLETPAPFDLVEYFREPPWEQNAAPLYLDALYEFYEPLEVCFPEEERKTRSPAAAQRRKSVEELLKRVIKARASVPDAEIDAVVASFDLGFHKLVNARRRPECKFSPGVKVVGKQPHLAAMVALLDVVDLRIKRQLERSQIVDAATTMITAMRCASDAQRRGSGATQNMLTFVEAKSFSLLRWIFSNHVATKEEWRLLLSYFNEHLTERGDPYVESFKGNYVLLRYLLRDIKVECQNGATSDRSARSKVKALVGQLEKFQLLDKGKSADAAVAVVRSMTSAECDAEVRILNAVTEAMLKPRMSLRRRSVAREQYARLDKEAKLLRFLVPDLGRQLRDCMYLDCRLALHVAWLTIEYWKAVNNTEPPDLETAAKAAGLSHAPMDPFSDTPLKLARMDGKLVVFSVGPDEIDQQGQIPWSPSGIDTNGDIRQYRPGSKDE